MLRLDSPRLPFALLDELLAPPRPRRRAGSNLPIEVLALGDVLTVRAHLPGLAPSSIDVSLERSELRIQAEREPAVAAEQEQERALSRELPTGPVDLRMRLGFRPDADGVRATYELGVLRIDLPRAASEGLHRVPVTTL
jgi:HSP20 family molecular chaperone IbpA